MNFHTFFPILSSSHFPIHLPLSRRLLWLPLKQVELVRRFVLPAKYYNQHYTVHILYTFVAHYIRRVRFYSFKRRINARSIHSLLVTASSNHLKSNNPWKPNNWSRFPMFIPWTMATFTSSSLVTYLYAILPKQISHPCRRIKSPRPGNLRRERSQDVCYTPETFQDQRVDDILISRWTDLCEWSARPRFPWISHGGLWLPGKGKFLGRCEQKGTLGHRILPGHPRMFHCVRDICDIYIYIVIRRGTYLNQVEKIR